MTLNGWLNIVRIIGPLIAGTVGGSKGQAIAQITPIIIDGIVEAEQLPGASGEDKKRHVLNLVEKGATVTDTLTGTDALPTAATVEAAGHVIDAIVDVADRVEAAHDALNPPED